MLREGRPTYERPKGAAAVGRTLKKRRNKVFFLPTPTGGGGGGGGGGGSFLSFLRRRRRVRKVAHFHLSPHARSLALSSSPPLFPQGRFDKERHFRQVQQRFNTRPNLILRESLFSRVSLANFTSRGRGRGGKTFLVFFAATAAAAAAAASPLSPPFLWHILKSLAVTKWRWWKKEE